jgi:hypothetical protein
MATITLTVSDALAARIVTFMKEKYPDLITPAMNDAQVFKAVVRHWVVAAMADDAALKAAASYDMDSFVKQRDGAQKQARDDAQAAVASGIT